jgi:hypothetical protein
MTIRRDLRFLGVISTRAEASGLLSAPGDAVLIKRGRPRLFLLLCPCGCGEEFPINLDTRAGPAWRLYGQGRTSLSLFPSVWRESGCESHFIIWRNKILLFGQYDEDIDSSPQVDETTKLNDAVREQLPDSGLISFPEIAEALGEVPWDVLTVCRQLVREGLVREGKGKHRGSFGRV